MRILLCTHAFYPSVGGVETCANDLAQAFVEAGHEVLLVTQTRSCVPSDDLDLKVLRRPSAPQLWRAFYWSEIVFHNNVSLRCLWPLLFLRRPWFVTTHTWICRPDGRVSMADRIKRLSLKLAHNVYISGAVAGHIGHSGTLVPNPYDERLFRLLELKGPRQGCLFVGRLVSDKGCDLLLEALALLREQGVGLALSVVGAGSEETFLRDRVRTLKLESLVVFEGVKRGEDLAAAMNAHEVLVVPSRWAEPFGLVALEGIACGCVVVASEAGGLPEAVGPCGITFPNGDARRLAEILVDLRRNPEKAVAFRSAAPAHLARHRRAFVAQRYLELFSRQLGPCAPAEKSAAACENGERKNDGCFP